MKTSTLMLVVAVTLGLAVGTAGIAEDASATKPATPLAGKAAANKIPLGSPDFYPSPEHPVGWRGDGSGRFPGATPPTVWSRRLADITSEIMVQAVKPKGKPGADSHVLGYFTIKDWLVAGPFPADDPEKDIDKDFLGGEADVQPDAGAKAGDKQWKVFRAYEGSQSFHNFNEDCFPDMWVDFVYAFGTLLPPENPSPNGCDTPRYANLDKQAAYAQTYLYAPRQADVYLTIKHDLPAVMMWMNGSMQRVAKGGIALKIHLNQGWNRLLVKAICDQARIARYHYHPEPESTLWQFAAYISPTSTGHFAYETKNISWMTKLTGRSASQPIVVGDKLFVGSSDADLLCLDKRSGKILWMHTGTYWDAMTDEERAGVKDNAEPLLAELDRVNADLVELLNANITPQGLDSSRQAVVDNQLEKRAKLVKTIHNALSTGKKGKLYLNEISAGNATPTSDGTQVYWVVQGSGGYLTSAFDLNGKRVWSCFEYQKYAGEHGSHRSPVLCEGKLLVSTDEQLIAYDAATGKELWRTPGSPHQHGIDGSPIVVQYDGRRALQTAKNLVSLDGAILAECGYASWGCYVPVVEDGVLYNSSNGPGDGSFAAIAIPKQHSTQPEILWKLEPKMLYGPLGYRSGPFFVSSPLYVDGLVYQVDAYGKLVVIDTRAKKRVYQRWMDGYGFNYARASYCVSPAEAGKNIYLLDVAGYMTVLKPGVAGTVAGNHILENVTNNRQEVFFAGMYFEGKRMFVHGDEYLYCVEEK